MLGSSYKARDHVLSSLAASMPYHDDFISVHCLTNVVVSVSLNHAPSKKDTISVNVQTDDSLHV